MNCSATALVSQPANRGFVFWVELASLAVTGLVQTAANVFLITRLRARREKNLPFHRLLSAQCFWGVLLLVLTIPSHVVVLVYGANVLSDVICCVTGTAFQVILGTVNTIVMLIALERYMKVIKSSEHLALFSKVNVQLMLWSTVLLHSMISLGPAYGWGQYTHSNERLRLWVVPMMDDQSNSSRDLHRSSVLLNYELINSEITPEKLKSIFKDAKIWTTEFYAFPTGMELALIASADIGLDCLRDQKKSGMLSRMLYKFFLENSSGFRELIGQNISQLGVELDDSALNRDLSKDRSYYESTICEVNYHVTSASDSFYLLMTSLVQIVLPVAFIVFLSARTVHRIWISQQRSKVTLLNKDYELTIESLLDSLNVALLVTPYYVTNFAVRYGRQVTAAAHFTVRLLLYVAAAGGATAHLIVHRQQIADYWHAKVSYLTWERDLGLPNETPTFDDVGRLDRDDGNPDGKICSAADVRRMLTAGEKETSVV